MSGFMSCSTAGVMLEQGPSAVSLVGVEHHTEVTPCDYIINSLPLGHTGAHLHEYLCNASYLFKLYIF